MENCIFRAVNLCSLVMNPIQNEEGSGGGDKKAPPYQFFPCNFYERRGQPLKLSDFYF